MKETLIDGWEEASVSMRGWILVRERPVRMIVEGRPAARVRTVWYPIPPGEGPVIRTVIC